MTAIVLALPGNDALAGALARELAWPLGSLASRHFPDGETYLRIESDCAERSVALVCTLDRPDEKVLPLLFAADALRELGATRVGLVAPYLAYMRQDRRFQRGEAVTSRSFARIISSHFDWLATIDPHLHRLRGLDEIYSIPARVVHATPALGTWVAENIERPLLVGPDSESAQWVADVAARAAAPYLVLEKLRHGDREVEVSVPHLEQYRDRTVVIVDDIISSARTMAAAVAHIRAAEMSPPFCLGVHAVFASDAQRTLETAGAGLVVTTDSIPHGSNRIPIAGLLAPAVLSLAMDEVSAKRVD
ncbi:ribose-phosphate pyrophosphokinase [Myxococcota bacterium]|nr:ribose-phosphate pyrophosphokinase [Myxococcota bacterium]